MPPRFANDCERDLSRVLDYHGIAWQYEPHTFVLEAGPQGDVRIAFTPDFYLPEQDLYIEVTTMKQSLVTKKNRKMRRRRSAATAAPCYRDPVISIPWVQRCALGYRRQMPCHGGQDMCHRRQDM